MVAALSLFGSSASAAGLEATFVPPPDLGTYDADPGQAVPVAGGAVFAAYDDAHGFELRFTDGTAAGTRLVRDLTPGPDSTEIRDIVSFGDHVLLFAAEPDAGMELWRSDGTAAGTTLVKDIVPGPDWSSPSRLVRAGSMAYFVAYTDATGYELWRSDGTEAGTGLVEDLNPGPDSAQFQGTPFVPVGDAIVLGAGDSSDWFAPYALYRADATGLTQLPVPVPDGVDTTRVGGLGTFEGDLIVTTAGADTADTVWRTDGTAGGTQRLGAIESSWESPSVTAAGGRLYLNLGNGGLWAGDGTSAGMVRLGAFSADHAVRPVTLGGVQYFAASDDRLQKYGQNATRLWRTDGTPAGTAPVAAFGDAMGRLGQPVVLGGRLLLGSAAWTPGSAAPEDLGFGPSKPLAVVGDQAIAPGFGPGNAGHEPWITDGTPAGTHLLADVNPRRHTARVRDVAALGDGLLVSAGNAAEPAPGELRRGLYRTDLTGQMDLLSDVEAAGFAAAPVDGAVLFGGRTEADGDELWRTDGTAAGTTLVRDIAPGPEDGAPGPITVAGGQAWFVARTPETGYELWRSDGTTTGTVPVADFVAGPEGPWAEDIHAFGRGVVFVVDRGNGRELWRSDGTAAGTARVGTMTLAWNEPIAVLGDAVYAVGDDGQVWATDGTDASPEAIATLPGVGFGTQLVAVGGRLYATASDGMWTIDPASGDAERLIEDPGVTDLTEQGDRVLVDGSSPTGGRQIWVSDGTAAGTRPLLAGTDDVPLHVSWMLPSAGGTWIAGFRGNVFGLWRTDGTEAGTAAVDGPVPTPDRDVYEMTNGADLYYVGRDALTDPWLVRVGEHRAVTPPATPVSPVQPTTAPSTSPSGPAASTGTPEAQAPATATPPVRPRSVVTPRGLRLRVAGAGPGEWTLHGALLLPAGTQATSTTCGGLVTVTVRRAGREVGARTVRLDSRCAFTGAVRAASRGAKLTFRARFAGNSAVGAAQSRTLRRPRAR